MNPIQFGAVPLSAIIKGARLKESPDSAEYGDTYLANKEDVYVVAEDAPFMGADGRRGSIKTYINGDPDKRTILPFRVDEQGMVDRFDPAYLS